MRHLGLGLATAAAVSAIGVEAAEQKTHGPKRPSFLRDRLQRYLEWYDGRLKPKPGHTA